MRGSSSKGEARGCGANDVPRVLPVSDTSRARESSFSL